MFYFRLTDGRTILHCGDMRAEPHVYAKNQLLQWGKIDLLYLDTTYIDPEYSFPSQTEMIESVVDFVSNDLKRNPKTLVVVGAYSLGKEKVFEAIAESLNCKIAVTNEKKRILACLNSENLNKRMTKNWSETSLHVLPLMHIVHKKLAEHLEKFANYSRVIGIRPSGWEFRGNSKAKKIHEFPIQNSGSEFGENSKAKKSDEIPNVSKKGPVTIVGIPYSEHSSFKELREFVRAIRPGKIIPTVYSHKIPNKKMQEYFHDWLK